MSIIRETPHRRWSGIVTRLRQLNVEAVLGTLIDNGPSTATEIAQLTTMSLATVNRMLQELVAGDVVSELPGRYGRRGQRARMYSLRLERLTVAAVVHQPGSLTVIRSGPRAFEPPVTVPQDDRPGPDRMAEALGAAEVLPGDVTCLVAGTVWEGDSAPAAQAARLAADLSGRFGCPVVAQSTVNLAAVAEARLGRARGVEEFLMVTDDGMALVVGGEPRPGAHGAAGSLLTLGNSVLDRSREPAAIPAIVATCLVTDPELVVLDEGRNQVRSPAGELRAALADVMATAPRVEESRLGRLAPALGAVEVARELAFAALLAANSGPRGLS
ncbi:ROK family transcriptional regulator [Paractinoplanes brasiliensis]|uniref:Winged helix-turn-helix DNA-binding protein n=1 Tax=Paractinoplanes brasiliensis TaxID=52695 RepID=A0A4R6JMN1_9ACTN|nr:helix-turn-helix domain-containing protein [Actinoplanes brasiliensis]TDO37127.1 winged helix-turn-helix DNA-binding protein [Actinoplanes brasiliensis]GID32177.1 hypothetical protein Abr02nite_71600 [Actinoplanes brasiliensis]